ncbi:MAG: hypothetical protein ACN4GW_11795 [Desulforhopalus sp.]
MVKKKTVTGSGKTVARLKKKKETKPAPEHHQDPMIQAMVWYREEHYLQLLSIFDDAELLPPLYTDWLERAEKKKVTVETAGNQVIKVFIDPETFPQWCAEKKLKLDANARSQLAIEVAQAQTFAL